MIFHRHAPRVALLIVLTACLFEAIAGAQSEFQIWQRVTLPNFDWGRLSVSTFAETEWHEGMSQLKALTLTEHFKYELWEHTSLGLGVTYLEFNPEDAGTTSQRWRLEPELIHDIPLAEHFHLLLRNRYEVRWIEGTSGTSNRIRNLVGFKVPLPESWRPLKAYAAWNDFHYDLRADQANKNWLVPASLTFELHKNLDMALFYQIETCDGPAGWETSHILGTHLVVKF